MALVIPEFCDPFARLQLYAVHKKRHMEFKKIFFCHFVQANIFSAILKQTSRK